MRIQDLFSIHDPNPPKARPETQRMRDDAGQVVNGYAPLPPVVTSSPVVLVKKGTKEYDLGGYTVELPATPLLKFGS